MGAWPSGGITPGRCIRSSGRLAGVGTAEYDQKLRLSLLEAEAVLALNPLTAAMLEPFASRVCIVPWGIDAGRFPWADGRGDGGETCGRAGGRRLSVPETRAQPGRAPCAGAAKSAAPSVLFMAAVAGEFIKGFHVAHEACRLLRQTRADFELVVTFDPPGADR